MLKKNLRIIAAIKKKKNRSFGIITMLTKTSEDSKKSKVDTKC